MEDLKKVNDIVSNLCGVGMVAMLALIYIQLRDLSEKLAVVIQQVDYHERRIEKLEEAL